MRRFGFRSRGFTLVELMLAVTILLIISMVCAQLLQSNARATLSTFKRIQANQYADQIISHLRRSNIAQLQGPYRNFPQIIIDADYSAEASILPVADDGSRQATVIVHWSPEPERHSVSVTCTLVPS